MSPLPEISPQRQRILTEAARLFGQRGYPATTIRQLAAAVELGASSLYNHMAGKQELLREICLTSAQRFARGMDDLERRGGAGSSVLREVIGLHVHMALRHPESVTVFNDEWRHLEEPTLTSFLNERRDYERRLSALLTDRMTRGELRRVDLSHAIPTLLSSLSWVYAVHEPEGRDAESLTDELYALWARGWQT